jgi:transposase
MPDGSVHLDRKSYPQAWSAYNVAQINEKTYFLRLLHDLCADLEEPLQTNGRPRLPISEAIFIACYKVYSTLSARRFMSDLTDAQAKGFLSKVPHFNSVLNALDNETLTPVLHQLILETSLPMQAIEEDFAADSSGFTTNRFSRWYDHKYGVKQQHDWIKVHLMCGVKTNIVTAVVIGDKNASDTKQLPALVEQTSKNFIMKRVMADKAYASVDNHTVIDMHGATPYIPFKKIHTGSGGRNGRPKSLLWKKMFHLFMFHQEEFMAQYHKRSNVEATFSMIKAKFGGYVRSKGDVAMKNEVLCKLLTHNICCLIQESHVLGIDVSFLK